MSVIERFKYKKIGIKILTKLINSLYVDYDLYITKLARREPDHKPVPLIDIIFNQITMSYG